MRKSGEITVFFSMILLCVFCLLSVMLESGRSAGARYYLQVAANSSIDSLFSQYHKALWKEYHILGLEQESMQDMTKRLETYLNSYLDTENWYPMEVEEVDVTEMKLLTDDEGIYLEQEILEYMKYGIWSHLDLQPEQGGEMIKQVKEAAGVQELADAYSEQGKEAWRLEKTLEEIYNCLEKQQEYNKTAGEELADQDFNFLKTSGKMKKEVKKIPSLVESYQKQADQLKVQMAVMEMQFLETREDLGESMQQTMAEELEPYKSYVEEDGARRQEIEALTAASERNLEVIEETETAVEEIQEYLDSLEEEEEGDPSELWREAESCWSQFESSDLVSPTQKDEEKQSWLEQIEDMVDTGVLELFLPEGVQASEAVLNLNEAPSGLEKRNGNPDHYNPVTRVLTGEYCLIHFTHFLSQKEEEGVQYEIEYLLGGEDTDRGNLKETLEDILALRSGLNLMHILTDSQKRGEAKALAFTITGAIGLAPLVDVIAFFIMDVWALGESIADVRALLEGENVPLIKTKKDWNLSLTQLLQMGKDRQKPTSRSTENGFAYETYLRLLLLKEPSERKYFRMMDLMQMNLRKKQDDFRMKSCAYYVNMKAEVCGKHVFFALPFVENFTGSTEHGYQIQVEMEKAY